MARGVNKAIILGNVGQDPEVRYTPSGDAVANLSIATDESYKDKQSGQIVPRTEWHRCSAYGKLAEIIGQYVKKGSKIYVEGRLATRKWQDQQGQDRYTTEIKISEMQMLDGKPEESQQTPQPQQNQQAANQYRQASSGSSAPPAFDDYDIPGFD